MSVDNGDVPVMAKIRRQLRCVGETGYKLRAGREERVAVETS
jgi:hypothetical protein